jgi:insertion element IS1 protein InsB
MSVIVCPICSSENIKKNGHIHNGKQNNKCKELNCGRQFVIAPTQKIVNQDYREKIRLMLLERISLRGICRVMDVSMPWLLEFATNIYSTAPEDLNVIIDMEKVKNYPNEQFDKQIYKLLEQTKGTISPLPTLQQEEDNIFPEFFPAETLDLSQAIDEVIANELNDEYTQKIESNKNRVLFNILPIEADELWSFVQNKDNKQWIWLAQNAQNRQIIGFHIGDRSQDSAEKLWESINPFFKANSLFFTDAYQPYSNVIPEDIHISVKKSFKSRFTNHIERFNNTLRQRCSRLVRQTLSFSKKLENHIAAIKYFICDYNKQIALHL